MAVIVGVKRPLSHSVIFQLNWNSLIKADKRICRRENARERMTARSSGPAGTYGIEAEHKSIGSDLQNWHEKGRPIMTATFIFI